MRYTAEHKEQSRERILEAARSLFRSSGFEGASIDQVTAAAGLTRGAFYAHFDSKEDLVGAVMDIEAGLVVALQRAAAAAEPREAALDAFAKYLDPIERANNATGCPLVAHPTDSIRGGPARKSGYTARLRALIGAVEDATATDRDTAVLLAVLAVGGALLSAASDEAELADRIEAVSLAEVRAHLGAHSTG